ncbi:MAG: hypothetical protein KDG89_01240 [Geminicoccaceae bacterium]|nr:hypothetical protein [Geminicoccaceae bacterium]
MSPPRAGVLDWIARGVFVAGLCVLLFLLGYQVRSWELWPTRLLERAKDATGALYNRYFVEDFAFIPAKGVETGTVRLDRARTAPGLTLVTMKTKDSFLARLIELDGTVRHEWRKRFEEVWPEGAPQIISMGNPEMVRWHGVHLYPNGDLLLNFEGGHFPYGGGLARLDKDSNVVWKVNENTHHDVFVADDGTIWVPAMTYRDGPMPGLPRNKTWYYEDTVLHVSPEGEVLEKISVLEALKGLPGLLPDRIESSDFTHLNNVETVPAAFAAKVPGFEAGDILVSLRDLSALVLIDKDTHLAKWSMKGRFVLQHDPDLMPNGHILLYDNRGLRLACKATRILEIDPTTEKVVWSYGGCPATREDGFYSDVWGDVQLLANGNVLFDEPMGGRVFEVTREAKPQVVWEWRNGIGDIDGELKMGFVGDVLRYPREDLPFLNP